MPLLPPLHETPLQQMIPDLKFALDPSSSSLEGGAPSTDVVLVNNDLYAPEVQATLNKIGKSRVAHLQCTCDLTTQKCRQEIVAFADDEARKYRGAFDRLVRIVAEMPKRMETPSAANLPAVENAISEAMTELEKDDILKEILQLFMWRITDGFVPRPDNVHVELFSFDINVLVIRTIKTV